MYSSLFFNATATTQFYTLSLHDALPICSTAKFDDALYEAPACSAQARFVCVPVSAQPPPPGRCMPALDRKSTRLNSSHLGISYAVFCLKKKKKNTKKKIQYNQGS